MDFKTISSSLSVSGQIEPQDIPAIAEAGFRSIICNRPDGESPDQPDFASIEAAALKAGLGVAYLPVTTPTLNPENGAAFGALLARLPHPILAYCRSGARSTGLAALAAAGG